MFANVENVFIATGRLARDPKQINEGRYVFSLAVRNPGSGGKKSGVDTFWPSFFVSGPSAEYLSKFCQVGDKIQVMASYIEWKKGEETKNGFDVVTLSKVSSPNDAKKDQSAKGGKVQSKEEADYDDVPF